MKAAAKFNSASLMSSRRQCECAACDIQCTATSQEEHLSLPLLAIEIIVHNDLTAAKLDELRSAGAAVLAIDLSNWGGKLTLPEQRRVVVTGIECKRWLHHPLQAKQMEEISKERAMSAAREKWNRCGPTPGTKSARRTSSTENDYAEQEALLQYGSMYRTIAVAHFDVSHFHNGHPTLEDYREPTPQREDLWVELDWIASELADLGAPGGADEALLDMMARLLSIYEDRGVGHAESQGARASINHVWSEIKVRGRTGNGEAKPSPSAAFALIAFQTFEIQKRKEQASRPFEEVSLVVRQSLTALETRFLWDPLYVPLVRAVFPEMAYAIDELTPRMDYIAKKHQPQAF